MLPTALIRLLGSSNGYFVIAFVLAVVVLFLLATRHMLRSKTSVVECWFCSSRVEVARGSEHSFVCAVCEQYNGFTPDGGYNKIIPEQHALNKNHRRFCAVTGTSGSQSDVLCASCTLKQSALLQKLSAFEPKCEQRWELELKEYKTYLEQLYPLCETCRTRSRAVINDIDKKLLPCFLSWWTQVRCRISVEPPHSPCPRTVSERAPECIIPGPLYRLARGCSVLCFLALTIGPTLFAVTQHHCQVSVHSERSIWWIRLLLAFNVKRLHGYMLPHCPALIAYSDALNLSPVVAFWFGLLFFLLQLIFLALHCKKRVTQRPNPIWFLVDILLLVLASHFLVSTILPIIPSSYKSADPKVSWLHLVFVIGVVFVPLTISVVAGFARWLLFCSADWQSQKQVLKESWPRCGSSVSESDVSKHTFQSPTSSLITSRSYTSTISPSNPPGSPQPTSELPSWSTVSPKPLFRPSVLGWPPLSSRVSPASCNDVSWKSRGAYTEPFRSPTSLHFESDQSEANFLTSASCVNSNIRPSVDGSVMSRNRRHKKRRRRSGLLRFLLSLLFGPVETFRDVLSELVCLMNAVLIGLVIYGTARLFMRLLEIY